MMSSSYSFKFREIDEIYAFLQEQWPSLNINEGEQFLTDPIRMQSIYLCFLSEMGCNVDRLKDRLFSSNSSGAISMETQKNILSINIVAIMRERFVQTLGLTDFYLTDVTCPGRKRSSIILSSILNFVVYINNSQARLEHERVLKHVRERKEEKQRLENLCRTLVEQKTNAIVQQQEDKEKEQNYTKMLAEQRRYLKMLEEKKTELKEKINLGKQEKTKLAEEVLLRKMEDVKLQEVEKALREQLVKNPNNVFAEEKELAEQLEKIKEEKKCCLQKDVELKQMQQQSEELIKALNDNLIHKCVDAQNNKKAAEKLLAEVTEKKQKSQLAIDEMTEKRKKLQESLLHKKDKLSKLNKLEKRAKETWTDDLRATKNHVCELEIKLEEAKNKQKALKEKVTQVENELKDVNNQQEELKTYKEKVTYEKIAELKKFKQFIDDWKKKREEAAQRRSRERERQEELLNKIFKK